MTYLCSETSFPHGGWIRGQKYTGVLCLCMTKGGIHSSRVNVSLEHKQDMIPPAAAREPPRTQLCTIVKSDAVMRPMDDQGPDQPGVSLRAHFIVSQMGGSRQMYREEELFESVSRIS